MAESCLPTFHNVNHQVLLEVDDTNSAVSKSIRSTSRVKFTCFDVSEKYLVLGANSGGIYIYNRNSLDFLQLIPNKDGQLNKLKVAPDEKRFSYSTRKGLVVILDLILSENTFKANRRFVSYDHHGWEVTSMIWDRESYKLFLGDDSGKVTVCEMSNQTAKMFFGTTAVIVKTDSAIIQLDFYKNFLLVSNMTKCLLCDVTREVFHSIGIKPREGEYGACFYIDNEENFSIFCARPGSRMWEVDKKAVVVHTHQFRNALASVPSNIISYRNETWSPFTEVSAPQSLSFKRLFLLSSTSNYILAWSDSGIYLFDVKKAIVILWNSNIKDVHDLRVYKNHIYYFKNDGSMNKISVTTLEKAIAILYSRALGALSVSLIKSFEKLVSDILFTKKQKNFCIVLQNIKEMHEVESETYELIDNIIHRACPDVTSLSSWMSEENFDRLSQCSISKVEPLDKHGDNGIVVVKARSQLLIYGTQKQTDLDEKTDAGLRKWTSLPLFNTTTNTNNNILCDELDGKFSTDYLLNTTSSLKHRSYSSICLSKETSKNGNYDFSTEDYDGDLMDELDNMITLESNSEYFLPLYGTYPRTVSSSVYADFLDGIEFDKLKSKFTNKLSSGKKALLYNIREIESHILPKQESIEDLDVHHVIGNSDKLHDPNSSLFMNSTDEPLLYDAVDGIFSNKKAVIESYPLVDTSKLMSSTEETLKKLNKPEVLYDPKQTKEILSIWIEDLHDCQRSMMEIFLLQLSDQTLNGANNEFIENRNSVNCQGAISENVVHTEDIVNANIMNNSITEDISHTNAISNNDIKSNLDDVQNLSSYQKLPLDRIPFVSYLLKENPNFCSTNIYTLMDKLVIFTKDSLGLSEAEHDDVKKLTQLSLQFGILGNLLKFKEIFFKSRENEMELEKCIEVIEDMNIDFEENCFYKQLCATEEESNVRNFERCHSCIDCQLSVFCQLYFHLLNFEDLHLMVVEFLPSIHHTGLFFTWQAVVDCFKHQETVQTLNYEFDHPESCLESISTLHDSPSMDFIAKLSRLMTVAPEEVIEVCIKRNDIVNSVDALFLSVNATNDYTWFCKYMDSILLKPLVSKKIIFESWLVKYKWLEAILQKESSPDLRCNCGYPRPAAHRRIWPSDHEIMMVIDLTSKESELDVLAKLCFEYSHWYGYMKLLNRLGRRLELLKIVVALSDLKHLKINNNCQMSNDDWKSILDLIVIQNRNDNTLLCINCRQRHDIATLPEPLVLQSVIKEMFKVMQPKHVINLLQPIKHFKNQFPSSLYKAAIILTVLNKQQSLVSDVMLKQYDTQLWSKRCRNIPQEIMQVFRYEVSNPPDQNSDKLLNYSSEAFNQNSASVVFKQPDRHWGISSNLATKCLHCNIILSEHVSTTETGLIIFPCGHTYHTDCVSNKYCLKCSSDST